MRPLPAPSMAEPRIWTPAMIAGAFAAVTGGLPG